MSALGEISVYFCGQELELLYLGTENIYCLSLNFNFKFQRKIKELTVIYEQYICFSSRTLIFKKSFQLSFVKIVFYSLPTKSS